MKIIKLISYIAALAFPWIIYFIKNGSLYPGFLTYHNIKFHVLWTLWTLLMAIVAATEGISSDELIDTPAPLKFIRDDMFPAIFCLFCSYPLVFTFYLQIRLPGGVFLWNWFVDLFLYIAVVMMERFIGVRVKPRSNQTFGITMIVISVYFAADYIIMGISDGVFDYGDALPEFFLLFFGVIILDAVFYLIFFKACPTYYIDDSTPDNNNYTNFNNNNNNNNNNQYNNNNNNNQYNNQYNNNNNNNQYNNQNQMNNNQVNQTPNNNYQNNNNNNMA